jgi:hypothetical protein
MGRLSLREIFNDRPNVGLALFAKHGEGAIARTICWDLVLLQPGSVDVSEEILFGGDPLIEVVVENSA